MSRFSFRLSGAGLALALIACGPSAVPGSSSHPASAGAPVATEPAPIADPEPPAADPHAGHGGHAGHGDHAAPAATAISDAERVAYDRARPVIERHCARCHVEGGAKATGNTVAHIDLSSYPFAGHHTHELGPALRRVLGADGGAPEMPYDEPGAVKGADLEALLALAAAWTAAHPDGMPAAEHDHHGGHH